MVLVHDAVSSPKARGEAWPGLGFRPITSAKFSGGPPIIIVDVHNVLIRKPQVHIQQRKKWYAKRYRGPTQSSGRNEHVPERPIAEPLKRPRRNPILILARATDGPRTA